MIVKMEKVSIVLRASDRDRTVEELGRLGVVHLEPMKGSGERLEGLTAERTRVERAIAALPRRTKGAPAPTALHAAGGAEGESLVSEILALDEDRARLSAEREERSREVDRLEPWGDFDPGDVRFLREKGVDLRLYRVSPQRFKGIACRIEPYVHFRTRNAIGCSVTRGHESFQDEELFALPAEGLAAHRARLEEIDRTIEGIDAKLLALSAHSELLTRRIAELAEAIELEEARTGMGREESLAYLSGYVPAPRLDALREAAQENGWGLLSREPGPEDSVPTLVENPKWIRIIQPMFGLLGLVPGYREFDISPWFLIFFSVFFALLVGDAAYGIILLIATFVIRLLRPDARREYFAMMYVFSICTIIWGSVTGTWFGSEALSHLPFFARLIVPQLYSFNSANNPLLMQICFTIAIVHLTIAHLMNFVKKFPALRAYEDVGSLLLVWGLYFLVIYLVVKRPLQPATLWLVVGGLAVKVIFSSQNGHFLKDALRGFAKLPLMVLNSVSSFSDIVSYVRLFAVGLATVAVASSFNGMAAALGNSVFGYAAMALILVVGHGLNVTLGALALIVHGVRLNLLEFSGHLEMEWTGVPYRPFRIGRHDPPPGIAAGEARRHLAEPGGGSDIP